MSLANEDDDDKFTTNFLDATIYTYRLILGDYFDTDHFGRVSSALVWILFLLCPLFNMIIMLNLLISIVSDSFSKVNDNANSAEYQEMASLIYESMYLIPQYAKRSYAV
jgi:hypothetical protein